MTIHDTSVPTGYLVLNGQAISRTTYSALYNLYGTKYGNGDGSTTFNLPDLRGLFVRGLDEGKGIDVGRAIGSVQQGAVQNHTHTGTTASAGTHSHTGYTGTYNHYHTGTTSWNGDHAHYTTIAGGPDSDHANNVTRGSNSTGRSESYWSSTTGGHNHTFQTTTDSHSHTIQTYDSGNHSHSFTTNTVDHNHTFTTASGGAHTHTITTGNPDSGGAAETRPVNIAVRYLVKAL